MNIIFHSSISQIGEHFFGKETFVHYLENLSKAHPINLITTVTETRQKFHTQQIKAPGITILSLPKRLLPKLKLLWQTTEQERVSLIYMPTYTGVASGLMAIFQKKKFIIYHGTDWKNNSWQIYKSKKGIGKYSSFFLPVLDEILDNMVSKRSSAILVTGGQLKHKYLKIHSNVIETRPIINLQSLLEIEKKPKQKKHFEVLFVGAIVRKKGIFDLLEAAKKLKNYNIHFTVIGDGSDKELVKNFINQNNLQSKISLKGYVKNGIDLFREYIRADALILPSYSEGFPRVFYEAMFFKTPIITTAVNSIPYVLEDGKTALFIKKNNPQDIKNKILQLSLNKNLHNDLAKNGKLLVDEILAEPVWEQHSKLITEIST